MDLEKKAHQEITHEASSLVKLVSEEGYLITRDEFNNCIRLGRKESGQVIYTPLSRDDHFITFEARLEEDKLGFEAYKTMWTQMRAFELLEPTDKRVDPLTCYIKQAKDEIDELMAKEQDEKRVAEILRERILKRIGRETIFPDGKCEVCISYKGKIKTPRMWGFVDDNVLFTPIAGRCREERVYKVRDLVTPNRMTLSQIKDETTLCDKIDAARVTCKFLGRSWEIKRKYVEVEPSNIMISRKKDGSYDVKVMDKPGMFRNQREGCTHYWAPEVVIDPKKTDQRTEIYSIGATIYTGITGLSPNPVELTGDPVEDAHATVANIRAHPEEKQKPVDPINAVPNDRYNEQDLKNLRLVLKKALQYDMNLRYQTFRELSDDLAAVAHHETPRMAAESKGLLDVFE